MKSKLRSKMKSTIRIAMRRVTRLYLALILVMCLCCAFCTACRSDATADKTKTDPVSTENVTIATETPTEQTPTEQTPSAQTAPRLTEIDPYVLSPADKYYLTDAKMEGYRKALDVIFAHESEVQLTDSYDDNLAILGYLQQNPYTFIVSSYTFTQDHKGLKFQYNYSAEESTEMMEFMEQEYLTLINDNVTSDMTELEEVLAIYRYFAERITYDYDWVEALNMSDEQYLYPDIVIYQALTTGKGVCHTYTYLCQFALQQLGIDCVRAQSTMTESGTGHMWLIVWIDGKPFHIDPTWDDTGENASLRYFGMTDEENIDRGLDDSWGCFIDEALNITCDDTRFAAWRDITDYTLIGSHRLQVTREDGSTDIINLAP